MVDGRGSCDGAFVVRAEPEAVRKDRDEGRRFANQAGFKTGRARCGQLDGGLTLLEAERNRDRFDCL